jgi:hypothetical protein
VSTERDRLGADRAARTLAGHAVRNSSTDLRDASPFPGVGASGRWVLVRLGGAEVPH